MLGLTDIGIVLAYTLCIAATVLCIVYGIVYWNKGDEVGDKEIKEELQWDEEEVEINDKL